MSSLPTNVRNLSSDDLYDYMRRVIHTASLGRTEGSGYLKPSELPATWRAEYDRFGKELQRRRRVAGQASRRERETATKAAAGAALMTANQIRLEANAKAAKVRREKRALASLKPYLDKTVPAGYNPDKDATFHKVFADSLARQNVKRVVVLLHINGTNVLNKLVTFRGTSQSKIYASLRAVLVEVSNSPSVFQAYPDGTAIPDNANLRLVIMPPVDVPIERLTQRFREGGVVHCVCDPIIVRLTDMLETGNDSTKKKIRHLISRTEKWRDTNPDGILETDMEAFAVDINHKIVQKDLLTNTTCVYNNKAKARVFTFTNTRVNHLDIGEICMKGDPVMVSSDELMKMYARCVENRTPYLARRSETTVTQLMTTDGNWRATNPFVELVCEFKQESGINANTLPAGKYPGLNELAYDSRKVPSTLTQISGGEAEGVLDMAAAYTQASRCPFFEGYPGKFHTYGQLPPGLDTDVFLKMLLDKRITGLLTFRVLSGPYPEGQGPRGAVPLLKILGMVEGGNYQRPIFVARFLRSLGFKLVLVGGGFGQRFDFTWPNEMLRPCGVPGDSWYVKKPYARASGILGMENKEDVFETLATPEYVSHQKSLGMDIDYYKNGTARIHVKRPNYNTTHHIFAYISSYTSVSMILAMLRFPLENIVGVELDGIHYRGELPSMEGLPEFKLKPATPKEWGDYPWFESTPCLGTYTDMIDVRHLGPVLLRGAGGTGKTYNFLTNKTLLDVVYVSPTNELKDKMKAAHGVTSITLHCLLGEGADGKTTVPYKTKFSQPARILLDELTMYERKRVVKALMMYPNSLFAIAGDVKGRQHFQCRNGTQHVGFSDLWYGEDWVAIDHLTDWRAKDSPQLMAMKLYIRQIMTRVFGTTDYGGPIEARMVVAEIKKAYPTVSEDEAVAMFREGDTWIASCKSTGERLLKKGVVSVKADPEVEGSVDKGTRTIHSSQGDTISEGKVFVTINDAFEYAQPYTAIARCVRMEQLVLVG